MEGNSSSSSKATAPLPDVPTHASDAELALAGHTLQTLVPLISDCLHNISKNVSAMKRYLVHVLLDI
jgi:hypothetical protein